MPTPKSCSIGTNAERSDPMFKIERNIFGGGRFFVDIIELCILLLLFFYACRYSTGASFFLTSLGNNGDMEAYSCLLSKKGTLQN